MKYGVLFHNGETAFNPEEARAAQSNLKEAWEPYATFVGTYLNDEGEGACCFELDKGEDSFRQGCETNVPDFPDEKILVLVKM